jgi:hypothetical protein
MHHYTFKIIKYSTTVLYSGVQVQVLGLVLVLYYKYNLLYILGVAQVFVLLYYILLRVLAS